MIIDSVRDFIQTCPMLKNGTVNANYLGERAVRYSIDNVPAAPIVKRYTDGGTLRQFLFVFASREHYGKEEQENFDNSGFYERFACWVEQQSEKGILPVLEDGLQPVSIEVLTSGYLYDGSADNARYQIQCKLTYYQEGV